MQSAERERVGRGLARLEILQARLLQRRCTRGEACREAGGWALPFDRPRATAELKWPRFADAQPDIGRDKGGAKGKLGGASLFKGGSDGAQGQNKIKV